MTATVQVIKDLESIQKRLLLGSTYPDVYQTHTSKAFIYSVLRWEIKEVKNIFGRKRSIISKIYVLFEDDVNTKYISSYSKDLEIRIPIFLNDRKKFLSVQADLEKFGYKLAKI
jgi:hypothetical protein